MTNPAEETFAEQLRIRLIARKSNMPPGPKGLPLLGNIHTFVRDPLGFCERMAREHGDLATTSLALSMQVWLNDPDLIDEVFVGQAKSLRKDTVTRQLMPLMGQGLLTSEGELWR